MRFRLRFLAAILCIWGCFSCDSRDPEIEYQELSSTVFEPREGMEKAREYLDHFRKNRNARISEVNTIYYEYEKMADFDDTSYLDCVSLISDGEELNAELSMSQSSGVRNAWVALYKDKRKRTQQYQLDAINETRFSPKLTNAAREACSRTYLTWDVEDVIEVNIGPAELVEGGVAKICSAEYQVHLLGKAGIRTYVAKVTTKGRYSFDSRGHLHFSLDDVDILDGPISADEIFEFVRQRLLTE